MFEVAYLTDKGSVRDKNDDRVFVNGKVISSGQGVLLGEERCLLAVCDGVGGEAFGDEAAEMVAEELVHYTETDLTNDLVTNLIACVNEKVIQTQKLPGHSKMSTTIACVSLEGDSFIAFNVGDSRVYRYKPPYISQISIDHSLMREYADSGLPTAPEYAHIITRYIGGERCQAEIYNGKDCLGSDDVFLLCTDGIWNVIEDDELERILSSQASSKDMCLEIYNRAIAQSCEDNISIIIVKKV